MHQRTLSKPSGAHGPHAVIHHVLDVVGECGVRVGLRQSGLQDLRLFGVSGEGRHGDLAKLAGCCARAISEGEDRYRHDAEGPDDMSGRDRAAITRASLTIAIANGRLALGIGQGIYLSKHPTVPLQRRIVVTVQGVSAG